MKRSKKIMLAPDEAELEAALADLQSALQENRDYLESMAADYRLSLPLAIRERLNKLHKNVRTSAAAEINTRAADGRGLRDKSPQGYALAASTAPDAALCVPTACSAA